MKKDMDSSVFRGEAKDTGQPSVEMLIARLESGEISREFDGEIWKAVEPEGDWHLFDDGLWCKRDPKDPIAFDPPPKFTTSIDAALSLVPADMAWAVNSSANPGEFRAEVDFGESEWAASPALALCIAALRARQTVPHTVAENPAPLLNTESSNNNTGGTSDGGRDDG